MVAGSFPTRVFCDIFTLYLGPEHQAMESLLGEEACRQAMSLSCFTLAQPTLTGEPQSRGPLLVLQHGGWRAPDSHLQQAGQIEQKGRVHRVLCKVLGL